MVDKGSFYGKYGERLFWFGDLGKVFGSRLYLR